MKYRASLQGSRFFVTVAVLSLGFPLVWQSEVHAQTCSFTNGVVIANNCPGSPDMGLQVNNAYAALPTTFGSSPGGGKIIITPGTYTITTPINLSGAHKSVLLSGQSNHSVYLSYSGTAINCGGRSCAIIMEYGEGSGAGLEYLEIDGPGTSSNSVGVWVANVQGNYIQHCVIQGFGSGVVYNVNTEFDTLVDDYLGPDGIGVEVGGYVERLNIRDSSMSQTTVAGIRFDSDAGNGDAIIAGTSFDDNEGFGLELDSGQNSSVTCLHCHFENAGLGPATYMSVAGGTLRLVGGWVGDDRTSGSATAAMLAFSSSNNLVIDGTGIAANGITYPATVPAINLSGGGGAAIIGPSAASSGTFTLFNSSFTGPLVFLPGPGATGKIPRIGDSTATSASAGAATLPLKPIGFLNINIGGTNYKIPYYGQ